MGDEKYDETAEEQETGTHMASIPVSLPPTRKVSGLRLPIQSAPPETPAPPPAPPPPPAQRPKRLDMWACPLPDCSFLSPREDITQQHIDEHRKRLLARTEDR